MIQTEQALNHTKGQSIQYVRIISRKKNISYPLIRTRTYDPKPGFRLFNLGMKGERLFLHEKCVLTEKVLKSFSSFITLLQCFLVFYMTVFIHCFKFLSSFRLQILAKRNKQILQINFHERFLQKQTLTTVVFFLFFWQFSRMMLIL